MQIKISSTICLLIICTLALTSNLTGQEDNKLYSISFSNESSITALSKITSLSGATIIYNDHLLEDHRSINESFVNESLLVIIQSIISPHDLIVEKKGSIYIISELKKQQFHVQGYIIEKESGERLPFATIFDKTTRKVFSSNEQGYYNIVLSKGIHNLELSYVGLNTLDTLLTVHRDNQLNLKLELKQNLPEVVIDESQSTTHINNQNKYSHDHLMSLSSRAPGLGGNSDLLQTAKYLPGVQSGSGGIGGYFVRGGSNDQNLFLLDGVSIYNPFHSLGLSSIFTPQTTKSLQVIKSGFRAQYGDKSAAVIDVKLKDGNYYEYQAEASVNPHDGFLQIEGPIKAGTSSFFLYGRHTTANYKFQDVIRESLFTNDISSNQNNYFDLIGKLNFKLDEKNRLFFTFYKGKDIISSELETEEEDINDQQEVDISEESKLNWGNQVLNIRWQSFLSSNSFLSASVSHNSYFSEYDFLLEEKGRNDFEDQLFYNGISTFNKDLELKLQLDLSLSNTLWLKTGIGYLRKSFLPDFEVFDEESEEIQELDNVLLSTLENLSNETSFYSEKYLHFIEGSIEAGSLQAQVGLRSTYFQFEESKFFHFQPRINLDYNLNPTSTLSVSAAKMIQYVHLLSGSEVNLPRDLWYPSYADLPPEESWTYNLGYKNIINHNVTFSIETYLRNIVNKSTSAPIDYFSTNNIEDLFSISGQAQSYGLELSGSIKNDKWEGMLSYGLSKSTRTYGEVNLGITYDFQFDRVHELKTVQTIQLSDHFILGLSAYIASGHPFLVTSELDPNTGLNPIDINEPGLKNSRRTAWNHRIDLSLLYSKKTRLFTHNVKINLYNSYNQNQPLFYTLNNGNFENSLQPNFSIPILPSISYTIKY